MYQQNIHNLLFFQALARIHDKNYIHRDVKRSNIMQHGKNIKLIDFEVLKITIVAWE